MAQTETPARQPLTAQGRYEHLRNERLPYLERARECAKYTLPVLFPPEGFNQYSDLYQPWQSVGARGVSHLASKLLLALMPPGQPFFRLTMDEYVLRELEQKAGASYEDARAEFEKALGRIERTVTTRLEQRGARTTLNEALKHLIVGGNGLLEIVEDGSLRFHPLSDYVVKRDKEGTVIEIVVKETVAPMALPDEALALVDDEPDLEKRDKAQDNNVDIYTRVSRLGSRWVVHQEVEETVIPGSEGTYPLDKTPWLPLRMIEVAGEDYGRSFVEEFLGDLRSLEALEAAITQGAGAAAKVLLFVDEGGLTLREDVAHAESGEVLDGDADDISVFQLDKFADFRVARESANDKITRLEESFLLLSGVRRDAERVTAEEIRAVINELEQSLGGVYSVLAQELQQPLVQRVMHQLQRSKELPRLPEDAVRPEITTGVDALGRQSDLRKLDTFLMGVAEMFGPEAVQKYVNPGSYMSRRASALGIDTEGLIKSDKQVQEEERQAMERQMMEKMGPEAVKQASQQTPEGQPPTQ